MPMNPAHLDLLHALGADDNPHTMRTLTAHLVGTAELLAAWGNPEPVCTAGLFHSIYGTQYYKRQTAGLDKRQMIASHIGAEAEELAWLFCACDRMELPRLAATGERALTGRLLPEPVLLSERTLAALAEIEIANVLEQLPPSASASDEQRARYAQRWAPFEGFLSPGAWAAFRAWCRCA